ncbi:hypothetical protein KKC60_05630 [Patescibacteria group bacterium]|nr:hypothetical protein [Patescibacteria group bacterium]
MDIAELKSAYEVKLIEEGIIEIDFLEELGGVDGADEKIASMIDNEARAIMKRKPDQKFKVLVDVTFLGRKTKKVSKKSQDIYKSLAKDQQVERVAFASLSYFLRVIITMILKASGKGGFMKGFDNRKEALIWLRS